jgi:phosphopantothenoylcysteine decarboxylase
VSRVILGVTGSVAAVKAPELASALALAGHQVRVVATGPALAFFDPATLPAPPPDPAAAPRVPVLLDEHEWPRGRRFIVGEPVLHIELRRWAEALLLAPLDAHTLAKLALGLCDNLLTCVYRAWEFDRPVLLAPAMNTRMWEHPSTRRHLLALLEDHGGSFPAALTPDAAALCAAVNATCPRLRIVPPESRRLACGDTGVGALASAAEILAYLDQALRPLPPGCQPAPPPVAGDSG